MRFILSLILSLIASALLAGISAPPREIAQTYRIGIISNQNNCAEHIQRKLSLAYYNLKSYSDHENLRGLQNDEQLDILIHAKDNIINLIFKNEQALEYRHDNYCNRNNRIFSIIYQRTQRLNYEVTDTADLKLIGLSLYEKKKYNEAYKSLKIYIVKNPEDASVYHVLGKLAYLFKDPAEFSFFEKAIQLDPNNQEYKISLGNHYFRKENYPMAIEQYSECLNDPINASVGAFNLGGVYHRLGNTEKAKSYYSSVPEDHHLYGEAQKRLFMIEEGSDTLGKPKEGFTTRGDSWNAGRYLPWIIIISLILIATGIYFRIKQKKATLMKAILSDEQKAGIKAIITQGQIEKAFAELKTIFKAQHLKITNKVALLENRWNSIKNEELLDVKTQEYIRIEKNKVVTSFLNFIDQI